MNTRQQKEALDYFKKHADDWARQGSTGSPDEVNVIRQRNDFVLKVIDERKRTASALDVGCGAGDLVCGIAEKGITATGIDFAKEMIGIAENKAKKIGRGQVKFECCSALKFPYGKDRYDVISANGFIEYISYKEFDRLLDLFWKALRRGGSLVLGSRNRLFNIFSLNAFTRDEVEGGGMAALILEAITIANSKGVKDIVGLKTVPYQEENIKHVHTGIKVSTRYQFTPAQLVNKLKSRGFEPIEIFPIHIHGLPPTFKDTFPAIHANISNLLQNYAGNNMCLIPQSSSFMIHGKK